VSYRVGIDVGGTFTDLVLADGSTGRLVHFKEPSTPDDPSLAVQTGLASLLNHAGVIPGSVGLVVHGTTLALNAIIQRRGAKLAMVVSRGHRDVLEIGRSRMPSSYNFHSGRGEPLVPRERMLEVDARIDAKGQVIARPDEAAVARLAEALAATGADAAAVMLLNSYLDPALEEEVAAALERHLPGVPVTRSAMIWPEIREFERALVAGMNAYVSPLIDAYLSRLEQRLRGLGIVGEITITSSNGGSLSLSTARQRPVETILSGPASGVTAGVELTRGTGIAAAITFDMGGTSADISVIRGAEPEYATNTTIGDLPLMMPVVAVTAIGAGGGSLLSVDPQGLLKVGPNSAGARPGPVCYGLGATVPAITDCYLAIGLIDPDRFLGGRLRLDAAAARTALEAVGRGIGLGSAAAVGEAALRVATARMATELFKALAQVGADPREFTLLPFGGAGPTHSTMLADEAGLRSVVIPLGPGTFCALGAICADIRRDFARSLGEANVAHAIAAVGAAFAALADEAAAWIASESSLVGAVTTTLLADMRYAGQAFNVTVRLPAGSELGADALAEQFHRAHEALYGFRDPAAPVLVLTVRVAVSGRLPPLQAPVAAVSVDGAPPASTRAVYIAGAWQEVVVLRRADLRPGHEITGPALIEQDDTTVWVTPGWIGSVDAMLNLRLVAGDVA
jgi:N-methylhydantoinase A